ncbi:S-adenosyl-L-methionine-binding protein [Methanosarcina horonobensis HB-1 = JCM 15518]|uniref:S-adenosyl-L-methionine-binding protein n=1 Tax=Methanosarcina horonobensis HB-1 = JCM 15518 TaxID=1434110 RepID=A0A0E3SEW3_9EURY|nr:tRNA (N6-threonylcarbamoyladenosine(37)-N6)-methyltransferase TrmO [Methanosarcina horonobensis]AKB79556.1 S-adenosyl-L-methionine-binding protein [Methanosarcina horonobensis HB-1 = JCM 15518]
MEIKLKTVEESQVASISHTGPVEEMGGIIEELAGWITQKELRVTQPPFAVYYTRPVEVPPDKMQYEIGIPFQGDTNGDKRVRIKIMPKHKILSAIHKGPYEEIGSVYAEVMQYITEGNYEMIGAPREVYITISGEVPDNELLTEVIFPVISPENFEDSGNDSNLTGQSEKLIKQEKTYEISPVGYVRKNGTEASLEIIDKYIPGLKELKNFSHVIILWWANRLENSENRNVLQVYPPYSLDRLTGIFATRAEYRPNPISITTCKIEDIDEKDGIVRVSNLDACDGTPIIDLKAYFPSFDRVEKPEIPRWLSFLWPEWAYGQ